MVILMNPERDPALTYIWRTYMYLYHHPQNNQEVCDATLTKHKIILTFNVKEGNQVNISKWWMLDCYARAFTNKKHNIYFFSWQLRKLNMTLWHGWMEVLKIGTFTCYGWDEHRIHYRLCRYIHLNIIQRAVLQKWFCFRM